MKHEVIITYDDATGQVSVSGPVQNRFLCYAMLGCAHEQLINSAEMPAQVTAPPPTIEVARIHLPGTPQNRQN